MALPAGASAKLTTHRCPSFSYDGIKDSQIVATGVTCSFIKSATAHFYDDGFKFPDGFKLRQEHPGSAVGRDLVYNGARRWTFWISGHIQQQQQG